MKEGRIDSAKTRMAEMKSISSGRVTEIIKWADLCKVLCDLLYGEVMIAENYPEKAIAVCEKLSPLGVLSELQIAIDTIIYNVNYLNDLLARAYQQKGEIDKAIAEYKRLITFNPASKGRYLINPKHHYRLAKLYEEKGWKGKAIEHYEKFLELWKDADPGIVEVEDAKKRLAGLR